MSLFFDTIQYMKIWIIKHKTPILIFGVILVISAIWLTWVYSQTDECSPPENASPTWEMPYECFKKFGLTQ